MTTLSNNTQYYSNLSPDIYERDQNTENNINHQSHRINDANNFLYFSKLRSHKDNNNNNNVPQIYCPSVQQFSIAQNKYPFSTESLLSNINYRGISPTHINNVESPSEFDPHVEYLYRHGLIGKTKYRYITNYLHIDSRHRTLEQNVATIKDIQLVSNPLTFCGTKLRINVGNSSLFNIGDSILINGVVPKKLTLRNKVTNFDGEVTSVLNFINNSTKLEVSACTNIDIPLYGTDDSANNKCTVSLNGIVGDTMTSFIFDMTGFVVSINTASIDPLLYNFVIEENVGAIDIDTQEQRLMRISECTVNDKGAIVSITLLSDIHIFNSNLMWKKHDETQNEIINVHFNNHNATISQNMDAPLELPMDINNYMECVKSNYYSLHCILSDLFDDGTTIATKNINFTNIIKQQNLETIGNVPINWLNNTHVMRLDKQSNNAFFVELMYPYKSKEFEFTYDSGILEWKLYRTPNFNVSFTFHHYGGILLRDITTQVSTINRHLHKCKQVTNIVDAEHIEIDVGQVGLYNEPFGGNCVTISIVSDIKMNYNNSNKYSIVLEKIYNNVVMVRMIDSIFPKMHAVFSNERGRKNNALYWQNLYDGDHVYKIEINDGCYDAVDLKRIIEQKIQEVPRICWGSCENLNNTIKVEIDENTSLVTFRSYNQFFTTSASFVACINFDEMNIVNSDFANSDIVDSGTENLCYVYPNGNFYKIFGENRCKGGCRIKIKHPKHCALVGQYVSINSTSDIGTICQNKINGRHIITQIIDDDHYDIVLQNTTVRKLNNCDVCNVCDVVLETPNMFRLRMDYDDTIGKELGFRYVGTDTAVTPFGYAVNNNDLYSDERPYDDSMLLPIDSDYYKQKCHTFHNGLSINGPPYLLILCKELQNVANTRGIVPNFFYKINLPGKYGKNKYNTFVDSPVFFVDPVKKLTKLSFEFMTPEGKLYDFQHMDHSFTLEIITCEEIPDRTCIKDK